MLLKSPHNRILARAKTPAVMGILNVGTESFSDGGKYASPEAAAARAAEMAEQGADIIDVGAESTKPAAQKISAAQELEILLPRLRAVRAAVGETLPISVDTYKPEVAKAAIEAGADIINDVYALRENGRYPMAETAAQLRAPLILTHSCRGETFGGDFWDFFLAGMRERLESALAAGLERSDIVLDAGIGFGKTARQNFLLVKKMGELRGLGCPLLLGVSRKSMFAEVAGDSFALRDAATLAVSVYAASANSCDILRVHDVASTVVALKTLSLL